ncbi:MAG: hypothetical protein ABW217_19700, partial [Polyangiaceae bacterium]
SDAAETVNRDASHWYLLKLLERSTLYTGCVSPQGQPERAFTHMASEVWPRSAAVRHPRRSHFLDDREQHRADPNERSALCRSVRSSPAASATLRATGVSQY